MVECFQNVASLMQKHGLPQQNSPNSGVDIIISMVDKLEQLLDILGETKSMTKIFILYALRTVWCQTLLTIHIFNQF